MKLVTGQHVIFTDGEYSDYRIQDLYRVVKDHESAETLLSEFLDTQQQRQYSRKKADDFQAFLVDRGFLERLEYVELSLGRGKEFPDCRVSGEAKLCVYNQGPA